MECPLCGHDNLQGVDACEECHSPLVEEEGATSYGILNHPISKVNLRTPVIVTPDTTTKEVVRLMKEKNTGCTLIVDKGEVIGIFTERDILRRLAKPEIDLNEFEIKNMMTPSPEVLNEDQTVCNALNKMAMGNYRHVPIKRSNGEFSTFSVRDALRYLF